MLTSPTSPSTAALPTVFALLLGVPIGACGSSDPGGGAEGSTSAASDTDAEDSGGSSGGSMSASGASSTTTSSTSGPADDSSTSDGSGGADESTTQPAPDDDMDGIADGSDNCPDVANPNQLDFDENGTGNVCDTSVFTSVTGELDTVLYAGTGIAGDCTHPLALEVTHGQIMVQFDDDGAVVELEITTLGIAEVFDLPCNLVVTTTLEITEFLIMSSEEFPVSAPYDLAMHDAGALSSSSDGPHPFESSGIFVADMDGGGGASPLALTGELPVFDFEVSDFGSTASVTFADDMLLLGTQQFMFEEPIPLTMEVSLTGLSGTLTLAP